MKKILSCAFILTVLTACGANGGNFANSSQNIGSSLLQTYVQNRCVDELQSRNEWRLIALTMSQAKQKEWENKICACAAEEAPNHLTAADLGQLLTEQGRIQVAAEVTRKTVTSCSKRLFQ